MRLTNEKPHSCPDGRRIHTSPLKAEFSNTAHREFGAPYFLPSGSMRTAQNEKPMNRFAERIRVGLEDAEMLANIDQAQLDAMAQAFSTQAFVSEIAGSSVAHLIAAAQMSVTSQPSSSSRTNSFDSH